jgi:phosphohistidine phosphatase
MEIYLLRHGAAEDARPGEPDSARELTREGRRKTACVLRLAKGAGVAPAVILSSPYIRARQTARIAADELGYEGEILLVDSLVPHGTPEMVWQDVRDHAGDSSVLLAGHEPLLGRLVAWLSNAPSLRVDMKKSAMVCLEADAFRAVPHGILRWMAIPKLAGG